MLLKKYTDQLIIGENKFAHRCYCNPNHEKIILQNVNQISFKDMYPNLIVKLSDYIAIDYKWLKPLKNALINRDRTDIKQNEFVNSSYLKLYNTDKDTCDLLTQYTRLFYEDIINDNTIYVDVDTIYYIGDLDLSYLQLPYETHKVDIFYLHSMKRYMKYQANKILTRGFASKGNNFNIDIQSITNQFNQIIRDNKLNTLLNES